MNTSVDVLQSIRWGIQQAHIEYNYRMGVWFVMGQIKQASFKDKGDRWAYVIGKLFPMIQWVTAFKYRFKPAGYARYRTIQRLKGKAI